MPGLLTGKPRPESIIEKKGSGPCAPRNKAFLSGESGISYDSELQASSAKKNMCPDIRHVLSLISVRFKMGEKDNIF